MVHRGTQWCALDPFYVYSVYRKAFGALMAFLMPLFRDPCVSACNTRVCMAQCGVYSVYRKASGALMAFLMPLFLDPCVGACNTRVCMAQSGVLSTQRVYSVHKGRRPVRMIHYGVQCTQQGHAVLGGYHAS